LGRCPTKPIELLRLQPIALDFEKYSEQVVGFGLARIGANGFLHNTTRRIEASKGDVAFGKPINVW
jgi:hypothetical protein